MIKLSPIDEYIAMFGMNDLIPTRWFTSKKYKTIDDVYRESVKLATPWRKLTGWNEDRQRTVLL